MSFRIEVKVLDKLRQEAENQGVSLNVLANKIFLQYAIWDVFEPKVGMIPVAKSIVSALFEKLDKKETIILANKIGKNGLRYCTFYERNYQHGVLYLLV